MNQKISKSMLIKLSSSIAMLGLIGCAHELAPVKFASSTNPANEITNQRNLLKTARDGQVDVLAPLQYKKAESYLNEADADNRKGLDSEKLLETLGHSKAYLEKADTDSMIMKSNIAEISEARVAAIKAGARNLPNDLENLDDKLKKLSTHPESSQSIKTEDKIALQGEYLNLELLSIKNSKLKETKNVLVQVKKKGAERITPEAYKQAVEKLSIAEKMIETDRHSLSKIDPVVFEASVSAHRVLTLLESEQNSRKQTPEERAVALESRDEAVKRANEVTQEVVDESIVKDQALTSQGQNLAATQVANIELRKREQDEKVVTDAAAQFDKSEADVYRQDGNLVIRLKTMNFATSRSDLPAESLVILTKVKDVMKKMGTEEVMVEGHTDGVGDAVKNQVLSEKRAQAVVKFFTSDKNLANNKIESIGFGYSKPLATNKTKMGRAQNRRVDIIIKPITL